MTPSIAHVVVTGAGGYIGHRLVQRLTEAGIRVTALGRYAPPGARHVSWRFGDPVPVVALAGGADPAPPDALVHLAHDWRTIGPVEEDRNLAACRDVVAAARAASIPRFVLGSTVSARPDALNRYGRIKAAMEAVVGAAGPAGWGLSARIGLVYGGRRVSQWGTLWRMTCLPVLPMLDPATAVQPIHLDDLCAGLIAMAGLRAPCRATYGLCSAEPLAFAKFLTLVSRYKHGRSLPIVPIPASLALALVDVINRLPGLPQVDRERVLGMMGMRTIDSAAALADLGLHPRPLADGLAWQPGESCRALLAEGYALMAAVAGRAPSLGSLRRYVRAVAAHDSGPPLGLPRLPPMLLRAIEPVDAPAEPLSRRLAISVRIVEAGREGVDLFFRRQGADLPRSLPALAAVALSEAAFLPLRLVWGRRWRA